MKRKIILSVSIIGIILILISYIINIDKKFKNINEQTIITSITTNKISEINTEKVKETTSSSSTSISSINRITTTNKTTTKIITSNKTTITTKVNQEMETYIKSVVACEMPALYNEEALKAQAIASRTFAYYQKSIGNGTISKEDQCYLTEKEMQDKWGVDKDKYYKIISNAVDSTNNLVMKKNNRLFKSYYFSTSNGYTESSQAVFKEGDLVAVESIWDKTSTGYEVTTNFTKDEIISKLGIFDNIVILKRNNTNHVEQVLIDNKSITGVEFRQLLGLRSTDFDIDIIDGIYQITTRGYGHGVGMSQYGANQMAKQGKTYQEILKYYYGNIEITNY